MTGISPLRFFLVAPLHSSHMLFALAAVTVCGTVVLMVDPSKGADVLGPLALLQMFAASTGFGVAARRGHLDLLFTGGTGRIPLAITHLALSVAPGGVVWATLGSVEMLAGRTWTPRAFASGTVLAFGVISALTWALSLRLPRLSGGIAWLLGITIWLVGWPNSAAVLAAVHAGAGDALTRAVVVLLCPFVLVGKQMSGHDALAAMPAACLATLLAAGGGLWIVRMDVPLESAQ